MALFLRRVLNISAAVSLVVFSLAFAADIAAWCIEASSVRGVEIVSLGIRVETGMVTLYNRPVIHLLDILFSSTVLPLVWAVVHSASRHPHEEGVYCDKCGYDLRATPDRCPECGKKVK